MLLSVETQAQKRTEAEAKQMIDSLFVKIKEGASLTNLVIQYSEDPASIKKEGVYTGVKKGQFTPEFETAVLALKPNEISKPFKTKYGYHIAQLISKDGDTYSVRQLIITYKK